SAVSRSRNSFRTRLAIPDQRIRNSDCMQKGAVQARSRRSSINLVLYILGAPHSHRGVAGQIALLRLNVRRSFERLILLPAVPAQQGRMFVFRLSDGYLGPEDKAATSRRTPKGSPNSDPWRIPLIFSIRRNHVAQDCLPVRVRAPLPPGSPGPAIPSIRHPSKRRWCNPSAG